MWICLVCGRVGCDRETQGHAKNHYELNSKHCVVLQTKSMGVWCYECDEYVPIQKENPSFKNLIEALEEFQTAMDRRKNGKSSTGVQTILESSRIPEKSKWSAEQRDQRFTPAKTITVSNQGGYELVSTKSVLETVTQLHTTPGE